MGHLLLLSYGILRINVNKNFATDDEIWPTK